MPGSLAASFLAGLPPLLVLAAVSVAAGLYMLIVFHFVSEPRKIRRAKDQMQAQLLAVRLFQDQLSAVIRAYARLLKNTAKYMGTILKPAFVVVVLLAPAIAWLDPYFSWQPLRPQQSFLMTVGMAGTKTIDGVSLVLPPGIRSSAPPVHIPSEHQVVWRLVAEKDGTYPVSIRTQDAAFSKPLVVSAGLARLSPASSESARWENWLLDPATASLPAGAPIRSIEVSYEPREINLWLFQTNWMVVFFVAAIGSALLLKKAFRVEI